MLRTIICIVYLIVTFLALTPLGVIVFLLKLLGLHGFIAIFMRYVAQSWSVMMIALSGCTVTVSGTENIPRKGGVCIVSNHSSIFDIVLLMRYAGRSIGFVAKKELVFVPLLNMWIYLLGGMFIDRKNPRKAIKKFDAGVARIKAGAAMLIFPEGHRSRGQGLLPFHPGSLKLATQSEAVIIPVAITGSHDVFEKNYRINPVPLRIVFCPPINTADIPATDRKLALSDQIYAVIKAALEN
ncbi:MAG: 1-acyl-sn-glycerol-3-phosphate acyltransferase [Treponema sp.]|nr:1-acyl-sn-glycerol-3-phosphate acyltransferase [Treponema sp.]